MRTEQMNLSQSRPIHIRRNNCIHLCDCALHRTTAWEPWTVLANVEGREWMQEGQRTMMNCVESVTNDDKQNKDFWLDLLLQSVKVITRFPLRYFLSVPKNHFLETCAFWKCAETPYLEMFQITSLETCITEMCWNHSIWKCAKLHLQLLRVH